MASDPALHYNIGRVRQFGACTLSRVGVPMPTSDTKLVIRLLGVDDVPAYIAHCEVQNSESGTLGELPFGPYSRNAPWDPDDMRLKTIRRWTTHLDQPGWRRTWGLLDGSTIVGAVSLSGGDLFASLHRADVGIGIDRVARGKGWGRRLMQVAIAWAKAEPTVAWLHLGVFDGNRAEHLYRELGFIETGRTEDCYRVDGHVIDNIEMVLRVGATDFGPRQL